MMRSGLLCLMCLFFILMAMPVLAAPRLIGDFESSQEVDVWKGLPHKLTTAHVSSGQSAMSFDVPNWEKEKGDSRPGVALELIGPLAAIDWKAQHSIEVDVWMDGATAVCDFGIKLVDANNINSMEAHVDLEPGKKSHAVLLMEEAGAYCDLSHITKIVLLTVRPDTTFTITVDNLTVVPEEKRLKTQFVVEYPNYRGLIMPDGPAITLKSGVSIPDLKWYQSQPRLVVQTTAGSIHTESTIKMHKGEGVVRVDHAQLPAGPVTLAAKIVQGKNVLAQKEWTFSKVSAEEKAKLTSYIDARNNLIVDGKPFFPLGWYTNTTTAYLNEIAEGPFNTLLAYGTDFVPRAKMISFLDAIHAKKMKLIYCANDLYPTSKYFDNKHWEGLTKKEEIIPAVINAYKDHPAVLAWYLNDEIPRELAPQLEQYYTTFKETDPNHPCYIVLCQHKDFPYLQQTTDILGGDPYPMPNEPVRSVSLMTDRVNEAVHNTKPAWMVPQAFGWYQYKSTDTNRGHIPSEEELKTGRAPTVDEARCMTYLALVHGAKALIYYCYYDMRLMPQYQEMWGWMKSIAAQVKTLTPVLMEGDKISVNAVSTPTGVDMQAWRYKNRTYIIAVNPEKNGMDVQFAFSGKMAGMAEVMNENRAIPLKKKSFKDHFAPLGVHVYTIIENE